MNNYRKIEEIQKLIAQYLVTPKTLVPISLEKGVLETSDCNFKGKFHQGVVIMMNDIPKSFFDDKYKIMAAGHSGKGGDWQIGYQQQIQMIEKMIKDKKAILDVGCGPEIPYRKFSCNTLIGVEYSFPSVAANQSVDLPICASAIALPLRDQSVDVVLAVYSLHHMVGSSKAETRNTIVNVVEELFRVVRAGGVVFVVEMAPVEPFGFFQDLLWDLSKKVLGSSLDQFFWTPSRLKKACHKVKGWKDPQIISFTSPWWVCFPPVFSLPWLKIPRFLYPLRPIGYLWEF